MRPIAAYSNFFSLFLTTWDACGACFITYYAGWGELVLDGAGVGVKKLLWFGMMILSKKGGYIFKKEAPGKNISRVLIFRD